MTNAIYLKSGGNWAFFLINYRLVAETIEKYSLKPVEAVHTASYLNTPTPSEITIATDLQPVKPPVIRPLSGGIKVAHLHYKGEIYLMSSEQWNEFSGRVVKGFQTRLAAAKSVDFEHLMELSETIDTLV